jgi:hypothetical protein
MNSLPWFLVLYYLKMYFQNGVAYIEENVESRREDGK